MTWERVARGVYETRLEGFELTAARRVRSGWEWFVRSVSAGDASRYVVGRGDQPTLREAKRAAVKAARQGGN